MTQSPIAASTVDNRLAALRDLLDRALGLMDDLRPSSIPAARLQQIIDELDDCLGERVAPKT